MRVAMGDAGITPPGEIIFDGKIHRFATNGKKRDDSGWYVAYDGKIPAGAFGCWRQGIEVSAWKPDIGRELTSIEQMQHAARMRELKIQRDKELAAMREEAAENAAYQWDSASLASDEHPYLQRKGIGNPGLKVAADGRLMAPMFVGDELVSLQMIASDGTKRFLKGGKTGGAWWAIGGALSQHCTRVYVAEGVATAASIFEATGKPVAIAYSASNMTATAQSVRSIVGPACEMVIVADNDDSGTGQREGQKAAQACGGRMVMPPEGDANDYAQAGGDLAAWLEPVQTDDVIRQLDVVFAHELGNDYHVPDELVQGLLTVGSSSVVYGDSNSGKTFFVVDLCCAIARGVEWMGRKTEPGLVIYLASEAPASIKTRIQAYQMHHGCTVPNFAIVQVPVNFYERNADVTNIIKLVQYAEATFGQKARIIVGDTLARISAGANENSGEDMGPVMARFDALSKASGAHVMVIHHNGKDAAKGARGWSGIRAHIDTEIELSDENGLRKASITKQRELPGKGNEIVFKLQVVPIGKTKWGDDATTCVVVQDEETQHQSELNVERETEAVFKARKLFEDAILNVGRLVNGVPFVSADAWNEFTKTLNYPSETSRRQALARAKKNLLQAGYITEVRGGYEATSHPVFAGAFLGL
jgi:putative DNA primase/helicase